VTLRYDPRDVAEIRVFHNERFLCRAICQELAGETVPVREIVRVRRTRHRELRQIIEDRRRAAAAFEEPNPVTRRRQLLMPRSSVAASKPAPALRRYADDD
jgi:putative transposase